MNEKKCEEEKENIINCLINSAIVLREKTREKRVSCRTRKDDCVASTRETRINNGWLFALNITKNLRIVYVEIFFYLYQKFLLLTVNFVSCLCTQGITSYRSYYPNIYKARSMYIIKVINRTHLNSDICEKTIRSLVSDIRNNIRFYRDNQALDTCFVLRQNRCVVRIVATSAR